MPSTIVKYPGPGCVVEFLQGNEIQIAWVLEEQKNKFRLFLPNRRETTLPAARLLPWSGPTYAPQGKDAMAEILLQRKERRESLAQEVVPTELWEMAHEEVNRASAEWFAELTWDNPDADTVAACGRALLQCRSYFRFQPPDFEVYDAETVEARQRAEEAARVREALISGGADWFRRLWEASCAHSTVPESEMELSPEVSARLRTMLKVRIADPETNQDDALWKQVSKGLSDDPDLPLLLATAWGLVPEHYDFWLDRADYAPGTDWEKEYEEETNSLVEATSDGGRMPLEEESSFISIDSSTTRDIDDSFRIKATQDGGWDVEVALACPAYLWDFESPLGQKVLHRVTSLYLPEGNCHMMPKALSEGAFSLFAGQKRPAFIVATHVASDGAISSVSFRVRTISLAANLNYMDCDAALNGEETEASAPWIEYLKNAWEMGQARLQYRISQGAVIIRRPDLDIRVHGEGKELSVTVCEAEAAPKSQFLVAELMIIANAALAEWAVKNSIPLLFRTQAIVLPPEYAGVWTDPVDIARIVHSMVAASMDTVARPHTGMGLSAYCTVTSPLRRAADLINEAQILHCLFHEGQPKWDREAMDKLFSDFNLRLASVSQVQRFRTRYWKYLYIRQEAERHGEECIWDAVVTELNDMWVNLYLPQVQISLRGKRHQFGEKTTVGHYLKLRLGKISPLRAEAYILGVKDGDE